ncbi:MAG TPA: hypothetical protein VMA83_04150 [Solirubrobacteraceae bacterium]|nr:hypothetical protein [Solirubrobacteraceae bacterium]
MLLALAATAWPTFAAPAAGASASRVRPALKAWGAAMRRISVPSTGCFTAAYPRREWRPARCGHGPKLPATPPGPSIPPLAGVSPATVGNGYAYSLDSSEPITSATGSFPSVSPGATEHDRTFPTHLNEYSLQLNTSLFTTPSCAGSPNPDSCWGWEQFLYQEYPGGISMQFWLINFNPTKAQPCPSGFFQYEGSGQCAAFSDVAITAQPTIAELTKVTLTGTVSSSGCGCDEVKMIEPSGNASAEASPDSTLHLAGSWSGVEFGIYGDCCLGEAVFTSGAGSPPPSLLLKTSLEPAGPTAPTCSLEGFTGETNNLELQPTPEISYWRSGGAPSTFVDEQSSSGRAPPSECAAETTALPVQAPGVTTTAAESIGETTALLTAEVDPEGDRVTACEFEYGAYGGFGDNEPCSSLPGSGTAPEPVYAWIAGLAPATTYGYRIVATNAGGTSSGDEEELTTESETPRGIAPPSISALRESRARWRDGHRFAHESSARAAVGTTFKFELNEPASVKFVVRRPSGRPVGSFSVASHEGSNAVSFQGRITRRVSLRPGVYVVGVTAQNANGRSRTASLRFRVVG